MSRRTKLTMALLVAGLCVCVAGTMTAQAQDQWRLGMQAYSFNRFTFYEAVQKNKALGMRYIEAYPGQKLSADHGDAQFHHNMSPKLALEVKQMLKAQGVTLVNYGVVGLPNNEDECRKVFNFARAMGIEIEPLKYLWCQLRINFLGLSDRVTVRLGNLFETDLSDATVVVVYLLKETNQRLLPKLKAELKLGTRILSNTFTFPDIEPRKETDHVLLYQIGEEET